MLVNIEKLMPEIIEKLKPLNPDKIILFGSYAYGTPNENSDVDLFLLKDEIDQDEIRGYRLELQKSLFDIQKKYLLGIDIFVDSRSRMEDRILNIKDQFYSDILAHGKVVYG
ncbi:MAG: nucleotidyltransferase domain-containing protein [Helicobacteraceae bacterium]|nr:nucleotidyltransferase domain-containing protein [Helicobacteraceae bacterium]